MGTAFRLSTSRVRAVVVVDVESLLRVVETCDELLLPAPVSSPLRGPTVTMTVGFACFYARPPPRSLTPRRHPENLREAALLSVVEGRNSNPDFASTVNPRWWWQ